MATGKRLIFSGVTISDDGGATNATTYALTRDEAIEIGNEAEELTVEGGQLVPASFTSSLTMRTLDDSIKSDTHVTTDGASIKSVCRVTLNGAGNGDSLQFDGVRAYVRDAFDGTSREVELKVQKIDTATSITIV